jgi:hypothetical protein
MGIGAKDKLDVALVKKYAGLKVDNPIVGNSMVEPTKMYDAMNDYASAHLAMLNVQQKLRGMCISAMAPNIQYHKTRTLTKRANA